MRQAIESELDIKEVRKESGIKQNDRQQSPFTKIMRIWGKEEKIFKT